jgi:hypothetical protein
MRIQLGDIAIDVVKKDIKNIHLSVYPPVGRVRISAPLRMDVEKIRVYAISKLDWVKKQQKKMRQQDRESPREYIDRESHFLWGRRYLLKVQEVDVPPSVEVKHNTLMLRVRPGTVEDSRAEILEEWYRRQLKDAAPKLVAQWERMMGVRVANLFVQRMRTKWGGCNVRSRNIRLNTELAKKPRECLEYILVHEMVHLLEPTHGQRFVALMDQFMPNWEFYREQLNRLPVRHESWGY